MADSPSVRPTHSVRKPAKAVPKASEPTTAETALKSRVDFLRQTHSELLIELGMLAAALDPVLTAPQPDRLMVAIQETNEPTALSRLFESQCYSAMAALNQVRAIRERLSLDPSIFQDL